MTSDAEALHVHLDGLAFQSPLNPNSYLTAKSRNGPSMPTRLLLQRQLVTGRVLDFGCGLGADVRYLRSRGFDVVGFDPHYCPELPEGRFDTILCHYVLNVLLPEEQAVALMAVSELLKAAGKAYYAVRRDIEQSGYRTHAIHHCKVYQTRVRLPYPSVFENRYSQIYEYRHINQAPDRTPCACMYCAPPPAWHLVTESAQAYAILENVEGATTILIVPKRHEADYFGLPERAQVACWLMARRVKDQLARGGTADRLRIVVETASAGNVDQPHALMRLSVR